jgi:hypothetical protein
MDQSARCFSTREKKQMFKEDEMLVLLLVVLLQCRPSHCRRYCRQETTQREGEEDCQFRTSHNEAKEKPRSPFVMKAPEGSECQHACMRLMVSRDGAISFCLPVIVCSLSSPCRRQGTAPCRATKSQPGRKKQEKSKRQGPASCYRCRCHGRQRRRRFPASATPPST